MQLSKGDSLGPSKHQKGPTFDDVQSRSTAETEESSVFPRSPLQSTISAPQKTPSMHLRMNRQTWRGAPRSVPTFAHVPGSTRESESMETSHPEPYLIRRDSDPGAPNERRQSVPVKCPPRQSKSASIPAISSSPHETDDSNYLMKMYDSRTWEMYRRITEARKNRHCAYASNNTANVNRATNEESTAEWENLQHEDPATEGGHEMIFLFDFD